ncbi:MAG: sigma-54 interaction domain-containing protein [Bacillota bacterium]
MPEKIVPELFLQNLAAFFGCQIAWWDRSRVHSVHRPEGSGTENAVPSHAHLQRLLSFSHPVAILKGKHNLCQNCPDLRGCPWSSEFFVPFGTPDDPRGMIWQFHSPSPLTGSPAWLRLAVDFSRLLTLNETRERDRLLIEFFRQSTGLCGQLLEEGFVLFNDMGEPVFENSAAAELNLYQHFKKSSSAPLVQNLKGKKELNLILDSPNPLAAKLRHFYFSREYLGGALFTTSDIRNIKNGHFLKPGKRAGLINIIGKDPGFLGVVSVVNQVAPTDSTVLLRGESGTGKEIFARTIHEKSSRRAGPFIVINCAAIPENLLESELFGYEEGSFTGARRGGKPGKMELAHQGTIFLDEIGDMSPSLQVKLLRVLQTKHIERVGGTSSIPIDVRIIAATHQKLEELIAAGRFREDLFYRISVIPITIPPLRDRPGDIELLLNYYVRKYCILLNKDFKTFSYEALKLLKSYPWPGNVRELENAVEYSVTIDDREEIVVESLPLQIRHLQWDQPPPPAVKAVSAKPGRDELAGLLSRFGNSAVGKKELARHLGISLATLYRWLKNYKL